MKYIANAFSLQMQGEYSAETRALSIESVRELLQLEERLSGKKLTLKEGKEWRSSSTRVDTTRPTAWDYNTTVMPTDLPEDVISVVGHRDVAALLSQELGYTVPENRVAISLKPGDILVVGQYVGIRLPEGTTTLPEGARIKWYCVTVHNTTRSDTSTKFVDELIAEKNLRMKEKCILVDADPKRVEEFLVSEGVQYQGHPDNDGRARLAKELGLSDDKLDVLLA